jgi:hypothetical protein
MPANSSGRMYFFLGSKNSKYFDFIEFTVGSGSINVDTTRVDRFGLKTALLVRSHSGSTREVGENYATFSETRAATFKRFKANVPTQFKGLATIDAPFGIPSPGNDPAFQPGGKYASYFTAYAAAHGAQGDTTAEIFGCGGTLSANPPLCAGLNRHVAQLSAATQSNPANFYKAGPANYYADFWHKNAINAKQYGFPYDDDAGQSSDLSVASPRYMIVAVGWLRVRGDHGATHSWPDRERVTADRSDKRISNNLSSERPVVPTGTAQCYSGGPATWSRRRTVAVTVTTFSRTCRRPCLTYSQVDLLRQRRQPLGQRVDLLGELGVP